MNRACELDEPKRIEPGNTSRPTLATEPVHALESTRGRSFSPWLGGGEDEGDMSTVDAEVVTVDEAFL